MALANVTGVRMRELCQGLQAGMPRFHGPIKIALIWVSRAAPVYKTEAGTAYLTHLPPRPTHPAPPHHPTPHGGPGVLSPSGGNTSRVSGWLVLPSFTHLPFANRLILITAPHSQCRSGLSFACGAPGEQNDRFLTSALRVFSLKHFTS